MNAATSYRQIISFYNHGKKKSPRWKTSSQYMMKMSSVAYSNNHLLYLNCSTGAQSMTSQIVQSFLLKLRNEFKFDGSNSKLDVQEINLWQIDLPRFGLNEMNASYRISCGKHNHVDAEIMQPIYKLTQQVLDTPMLVVACPMWNYSCPFVLKQYFDCVTQPNITFQLDPTKEDRPVPIVGNRPVVLITSSGGGYSGKRDYLHPLLDEIFPLLGFEDIYKIQVKNSVNSCRELLIEEGTQQAKEIVESLRKRNPQLFTALSCEDEIQSNFMQ